MKDMSFFKVNSSPPPPAIYPFTTNTVFQSACKCMHANHWNTAKVNRIKLGRSVIVFSKIKVYTMYHLELVERCDKEEA